MIELGAIHLLRLKGTCAPLECTLSVPYVALSVVRLMKDCFQTNTLQETKSNEIPLQILYESLNLM